MHGGSTDGIAPSTPSGRRTFPLLNPLAAKAPSGLNGAASRDDAWSFDLPPSSSDAPFAIKSFLRAEHEGYSACPLGEGRNHEEFQHERNEGQG
jgi:hypothetical protein